MPAETTPPLFSPARLQAAAVAVVMLAVLAVAAWLDPDAAGHGTHTQLGMPRCGWVVAFDKPCPTCGMTTSFALAAGREPTLAFLTQPLGALLALVAAAAFWAGLHQAALGVRVGRSVAWLAHRRAWVVYLAIGAAAWVYKLMIW